MDDTKSAEVVFLLENSNVMKKYVEIQQHILQQNQYLIGPVFCLYLRSFYA
jgi:hypothetical protein